MRLKHRLIPVYQWAVTTFSGGRIPLSSSTPNAVIFLRPDYGNIGDLAIGYAQETFLSDLSADLNVVSVPLASTYRVLRSLRRNLGPQDIVFTVGGGSFGDLYPKADYGREFIVSYLKNVAIVSFPQSMTYSETRHGRTRLTQTVRTFAKARRFILNARDSISRQLMRQNFDNDVIFAPDIVLSMLDRCRNAEPMDRHQFVAMLRNDGEAKLRQADRAAIVTRLSEEYGEVLIRDNTIDQVDFDASNLHQPVFEMLDTFRESRLVVTDRLHGMIFAAITGTPCIVFANSNHKIRGMYQDWIHACNFVVFVEEFSMESFNVALGEIRSMASQSNYSTVDFDFLEFSSYIEKLVTAGYRKPEEIAPDVS